MSDQWTRRSFVGLVPGALALGLVGAGRSDAQDAYAAPGAEGAAGPGASFPAQDPALVREVVGASHGRIERVRELVEARPALAKAAWDWGFGDWESALGAASHTGQRAIAELLLAHGARPTLFSAAMLGQLAVVKAFVEASPGIQSTPGPHGIPLLDHARAGGPQAAAVVAWLEEVGGADPAPAEAPLDPADHDRLLGEYTYGPGAGGRITVAVLRDGLGLAVGAGFPRGLFHHGDLVFHPAGASAVRIRFARAGDAITHLTIDDGEVRVTARRS